MGPKKRHGGRTPESSMGAEAQPQPERSKGSASGLKRVKSPEVFVLDGNRAETKVMQLALEREGIQCKAFTHARECLDSLLKCACDILVVDLAMQDVGGVQVVVEATSIRPGLPVVVITDHGDRERAALAMKKGAVDFVERHPDGAVTVGHVKSATTPSTQSEGEDIDSIGELVAKRNSMAGGKRKWSTTPAKLSTMEKVVLKHILNGNGNRHIAMEIGKSVRTVEDHRSHLMRKMGVDNIVDLVKRCIDTDAAEGDSSQAVRRQGVGDVVVLVKRCIDLGLA
jgi:two-component system, LuxR family, response regulator FixJ